MNKPLLQIALDNLTIEDAIKDVEKVRAEIDVIEVGTILISSQGVQAVKKISSVFPEKIIVADGKIADAGNVFAKMFFSNGAQFTTAICAAETPTMKSILDEAAKYKTKKELQVELTSHFTWEQVDEWKKIGITQIVYHRSRDSQSAGVLWSNKDLHDIEKLSNMGFKMTITGGITVDDIRFFQKIPIYIFIAGRAIRNAPDPKIAAQNLKKEISKYW